MGKLKKLIAIVLAMLTTIGFAQSNDWYKLEKKEFGFKIEFPKKPKTETCESDSEFGFFYKTNNFYCITKTKKDDNFDYFILHTEFPDSLTNSDNINKEAIQSLYKSLIDKEVKFLHGKLLSEKIVVFKGYTGIAVKYENIEKDSLVAVVNMRIFLVKNNLYKMKTVTYTEFQKDDNPSMKRFFDSFDLLYL